MIIDLQEDAKPKMETLHKLSQIELDEMKKQDGNLIASGFIRPITSPWGSPVQLLTFMKDGGLRICIDYRLLKK